MTNRTLQFKCFQFIVIFFICGLTYAQKGPGIPNQEYPASELYRPIWTYSTMDGKINRYLGSNLATMVNGYLFTTYHKDGTRGDGVGGILVYDVSNPRSPVLKKKIQASYYNMREPHGIGQHKDYICIQDDYGVTIWDFKNPVDPKLVVQTKLPGYAHRDYEGSWQIFWQAPYIFIGRGFHGWDVVDASDFNNIHVVKHMNAPSPQQSGPIFAIGNLLITTAHIGSRGFTIYDISNPRNPVKINQVGGTENIYAGYVNGNRMITSAFQSGNTFTVNNFRDLTNVTTYRFRLGNPKDQLYCSTQDQYIFQGVQDWVYKIDVSKPNNYKILGRGQMARIPEYWAGKAWKTSWDLGQVTPIGNLLFVGNDHGTGSGFLVHQTGKDTVGPSVNMVSPSPFAVKQAVTSRVGVTLTDNVDINTINIETFIVRPVGGEALPGKYSHQFSTINFSPDQPLQANTTYEVVIPKGGIKDWMGVASTNEFKTYFSTGNTVDEKMKPSTPLNLYAYSEGTGAKLEWDPAKGVDEYVVKRSYSHKGPFEEIGRTTSNQYMDGAPKDFRMVYYVVCGENKNGEGPESHYASADNLNVSVDENTISDQEIILFPNPAKDDITVLSSNQSINMLVLRDLSGRVLIRELVNNQTQVSLDVSNISSGIYLLDVEGVRFRSSKKITIE